jgi:uncharacterized protein (TIGR00255 family)
MTGYGEVRITGDGFELMIETKSVNNRFLKVSSKISEEISYLQNDLEEEVRRHVERGSVFLSVHFRPTRFTDLYDIDEGVLRKYRDRLKVIRRTLGHHDDEVHLKDLLLLPGVIHTEENVILAKKVVLPVALKGLEKALRAMIAMREREGRNLHRHFKARGKFLQELLARVAKHAPHSVESYQNRLLERVNRLLAVRDLTLNPQDLLKEVAILAERSDITEEIERLQSHLEQFGESLEAGEPVGRKLEFLIQEMFRESNTMASKSISPELSRDLVDIKAEVDRLKEQIQNVE